MRNEHIKNRGDGVGWCGRAKRGHAFIIGGGMLVFWGDRPDGDLHLLVAATPWSKQADCRVRFHACGCERSDLVNNGGAGSVARGLECLMHQEATIMPSFMARHGSRGRHG